MSPLLTLLILWPLAMALAIAATPRTLRFLIRLMALVGTLVPALLAGWVFVRFDPGQAGFQFEHYRPWIASLGLSYHVGVDGLNVGLVLMAAVVAFAATAVSWDIEQRQKEYYVLLLVMAGGVLGAFVSLDLVFLYAFHELALVPTFLMIGVWGRGPERGYATFKLTLYLSAGALIALVGLILLYVEAGAKTFNVVELTRILSEHPLEVRSQGVIFGLLALGFGILVSLWPFHTWAPLGYAAAPTATAMLHAGALKKFGLYGLIRIALPLLPAGAQQWLYVLAFLCLGNAVYAALVAMRQRDLNRLLGNSSVAHMGFAFLGLASFTLLGVTGAVMVMVAHGFLAALSFALSGYLYRHAGTLQLDQLGGLVKRLPFIGTAMVMAMLAGCGLPGFANFVGEALVLFGAWKTYQLIVVFAAWGGLILGAVYMLRAIRAVWHGPLPERWAALPDATGPWRRLPYALLLGCLLLFGCVPALLIDKIEPGVRRMLDSAAAQSALATARAGLEAPQGPRPPGPAAEGLARR